MAVQVGLSWLPIVTVAFLVIGCIISYIMALTAGHIAAVSPYISDTGDHTPESCVFAQFFNLSAAFAVATFYVRYKLVFDQFNLQYDTSKHLRRTNVAGLIIGFVVAFGISLVGNFQWTAVPIVHCIGAVLGIPGGIVYCWLDVVLTWFTVTSTLTSSQTSRCRSPTAVGGKCMFVLRVLLSIAALATIIIYYYFYTDSVGKFTGTNAQLWHSSDGGYTEHLVSTSSQWASVVCIQVYLLTYVPEFSRVGLIAVLVDSKCTASDVSGAMMSSVPGGHHLSSQSAGGYQRQDDQQAQQMGYYGVGVSSGCYTSKVTITSGSSPLY